MLRTVKAIVDGVVEALRKSAPIPVTPTYVGGYTDVTERTWNNPGAGVTKETQAVSLEEWKELHVFVYSDQPVGVKVLGSFDGLNFWTLSGYEIAIDDFSAGELNNIIVPLRVKYAKVAITTGSASPTVVKVFLVRVR